MSELSVKHLLGIKYLNLQDIELIFKTADNFKEIINRKPEKMDEPILTYLFSNFGEI